MSVPSLADRAACLVDHSARHDIWNLARGGDLDLSGSGTDGPPYFLESRTENRRTAGVWPLIIGLSMWVLARTAALSDSGLIARQNATMGVCVYFSRPVNTIMSLLRSLDRPHACRAL